jgi:hypothetical protein
MRRAEDRRCGTLNVIEPNGIEPAEELHEHLGSSQHGIEARVLTARLFASMRLNDRVQDPGIALRF